MRYCLFIGLLLSGLAGPLVLRAVAQTPAVTTLSGDVADAATGKPLPFANVYLNNTTRGTTTNETGRFTLTNVPLGTIDVVASFLGYQTVRQSVRVDNAKPQPVRFRLKADNRALAGVTVRAKSKDRTWQRQFRRFKDQLLGEPFGGQCLITNSFALTFTDEKGHLTATATEPLVIENQALGYRLYYDLQHFDGSYQRVYYAGTSRFEELPATDERQATRFGRNRLRAYRGSLRHLMTSLVAGTVEREHFLVYQEDITQPMATDGRVAYLSSSIGNHKRLRPFRSDSLIQPGKLAFERRLVSSLPLVIFYTQTMSGFSPYRDARYAYSELSLPNGHLLLTTDGWITAPNGMEVKGSLADDRLSTLLPADWKPLPTSPTESSDAPLVAQGTLLPPDARSGRIQGAFADRFRNPAPALFVHVDKPFYATGDRMWLSAYLLDAVTHRRLIGETALQVDLLTPTGRLVQHQWLYVNDGRAVGDFRLSDSLDSGTYRLRAYTDEDDNQRRPAFERSIAVYNLLQAHPVPAGSATPEPLDVQVLPEGGRWVVGVPARLGIKVVGRDGRGRMTSGRVVDETGREAGRFATNALGMGRVELTPQPDRAYSAEVLYGQTPVSGARPTTNVALPVAEATGLTLSVDMVSDTNRLIIRVAQAGGPAIDSAYLLIQQQGQVSRQHKVLLENRTAQFSLPVVTLPPGLNQILLYDAAARPQAERLVFIPERLPPVGVMMTTNKARYQPRESVGLNITLTDDGQPAVAALSVSITDIGSVPDDTAGVSMRTHLLLTGELRGRVEHPEFYVNDTSPATRRALDDLLLTQGWRRVSGTTDADWLGGVSVMGRILNAKGQPIPAAQIMLAATNAERPFVRSAGADEQGRFRLAGLAVTDTLPVLVQLTDHNFKNLPVADVRLVQERAGRTWARTDADTIANWTALTAQLATARVRQEADAERYRDKTVRLLKEVVVRARKTPERSDDVRRMSLHGVADNTVIFEENGPRYANLYDMLRGRVPGVTVSRAQDGAGYQVNVRGISSMLSSTQPLFLMDGMPVMGDEATSLLAFNPGDVERVEVLKNGTTAGIYGVRAGNGVIAFYSKRFRTGQSGAAAKKTTQTFQLIGYPAVQREFYVPRYDQPDEATIKPDAPIDRRDVLHWKPLAQTDANGQTGLRFPLSDVVGTMRVTVQGITTDGRAVSAVRLIRVQ